MERTELASFLRTRRERVLPQQVGLAAGPGRRTPGLRRQEVAQLAGISVDYYIRLEQARGPHPSTQVLEALARALRLSGDERAHLFHLVGTAPLPTAGAHREVPVGIRQLLERLDDTPAIVVDPGYVLLAWNPMWAALTGTDPATLPAEQRSALHGFFSEDGAGCPAEHARDVVADLRAATARHPTDPALAQLVADLSARSPAFRQLWATHEVAVRRDTSKRLRHPLVGELTLDVQTLQVPGEEQRLMLFTAAPDSPSAQALQLLKVVGLEEFADHS
ncbi:helix-turn-helix domain-containing protein [Natronosporangium hydrolyticum]|uniref:Helix-turn-helix domain-containing protein n=1 Tax=Natronosporangium hydrolyticum TaxID=2811111 RepID=A0A895YCZ5_9ACTN|nr:helix-turn-helix transcriptional regulator [Natronosporangium hydrolyticum]QSB13323.1 helix-turn-helix domain-containing protein [Natronosporangium hydrolyticum]